MTDRERAALAALSGEFPGAAVRGNVIDIRHDEFLVGDGIYVFESDRPVSLDSDELRAVLRALDILNGVDA